MHIKLSLEREVDQMVNDMMKKEGWTRSYALSVLRSKFETEERYQEVAYVNDLIKKESEEQEKGPEFKPTTNTVAEEIATATTIKEPKRTSSRQPSKVTPQKTIPLTSLSKQLDKQTTQIDKKIIQIIQPLQIKSIDKQSQMIKQLQSQLKQLQKQLSQIQKAIVVGKKKKT